MIAQVIRLNPEIPMPKYATRGSAAIDLYANMEESLILGPQTSTMIGTGLKIWHINEDIAGLILPRSGLGSQGLVLRNLVGLIDGDYQGELLVAAWNSNTDKDILVPSYRSGKAFAQYAWVPIVRPEFEEVTEFSSSTTRGTGGFGHSDNSVGE